MSVLVWEVLDSVEKSLFWVRGPEFEHIEKQRRTVSQRQILHTRARSTTANTVSGVSSIFLLSAAYDCRWEQSSELLAGIRGHCRSLLPPAALSIYRVSCLSLLESGGAILRDFPVVFGLFGPFKGGGDFFFVFLEHNNENKVEIYNPQKRSHFWVNSNWLIFWLIEFEGCLV